MARQRFDDMDNPLPRVDPVRERLSCPLDPSTVKVGDVVAIITYGVVRKVTDDGEVLLLENIKKGGTFDVTGRDMIADLLSADYYARTERLGMQKMAEVLISCGSKPVNVFYVKKDGQERVLRGHFLSQNEKTGRSLYLDLELYQKWREAEEQRKRDDPDGQPLKEDYYRWVDHRTLKHIIVDGVRYMPT